MTTPGSLDITVKINEFPDDIRVDENNWKSFTVDCDGTQVSVTVKPKVFKKLEQAQENYPMWVAAIAGKLGGKTEGGFELAQPNIQVFERKPKPPKEPKAEE